MPKVLGVVILVAATGLLTYSLWGRTRSVYLPGPTTSGHYQIELACNACHTEAFADRNTLQKACVKCHGAALEAANDAHPESKFTDPRNADRVAKLDARLCVTCHREHRPELVSSMGLSLPKDYCFRCHESIGSERPSHAGLRFDTCADAACHNFHDNRALYEDFLEKHLDDPADLAEPKNPALVSGNGKKSLALADADAPASVALGQAQLEAWSKSAHARAGVNCGDCHVTGGSWRDAVPRTRCAGCHDEENAGYLAGRHGMREAAGLGPMIVADARQPMKPKARERRLGCTSCHSAHRFDTRHAAVEACLGCHDDAHSKNYLRTRHAELWQADASGRSGASCATCHLPRLAAGKKVTVQHNQNDTLRPNEKMVRPVCANCHGIGFSLSALSDPELVRNNFNKKPSREVRSLAMVRARQNPNP